MLQEKKGVSRNPNDCSVSPSLVSHYSMKNSVAVPKRLQ